MAQADQRLQDLVLRLPSSLRDRAEEMATHESISLNLFIMLALAEKLQRLQLKQCLELSEKEALTRDANGDILFLSPSDRVH